MPNGSKWHVDGEHRIDYYPHSKPPKGKQGIGLAFAINSVYAAKYPYKRDNSTMPKLDSPTAGFIYSVLAFLLLCAPLSAHDNRYIKQASGVLAAQITAHNAAQLVQQGPDAAGGVGDWYLSNGILCAVVSNIDHESDLSVKGGVLIDLGYCDRPDDQFVAAQDLLEGSRATPVDIDRIDIAMSEDSASILTLGGRNGIIVETRYTLNKDQPDRLHISKVIRLAANASGGFSVYLPIGFNYHSMEVFVLSSLDLTRSNGFQQEDFVERGLSAFDQAARYADTIITISPRDSIVPISYGWRMKTVRKTVGGETVDLPYFALADDASTAFIILSEPFILGDATSLGLLQLLQVALMGLEEEATINIEEEILVSRGSDVASITDKIFNDGHRLTGIATEATAVVHLDFLDGTPLTHMQANERGEFSGRVPNGEYRLSLLAPGGRKLVRNVSIEGADVDLGLLNAGQPARVLLPTGDAMRLIFRGLDATPQPNFQDSLSGFSVLDDDGLRATKPVSSLFLAGIESDRKYIDLTPGEYQVYATRGIEYSLEKSSVTAKAGEQTSLNIAVPKRVVESDGYIAADFHVHSGPSMDNALSTVERLRTFVAEHGEVMVASEHDTVFSFDELVKELDLSAKIITITGTEMTSEVPSDRVPKTIGHANFFPLEPLPHAFRRGAPNGENRRVREVIHEMQRRNPTIVSQLNHARRSLDLSGELPDDYREQIDSQAYLDHMGPAAHPYQPTLAIDSYPNNTLIEPDPISGLRDIDFDVIEIMNGPQGDRVSRIEAMRLDWFSFLRQGIKIVGSANSDSHTRSSQVAMPRNMVAVQDDSLAAFDIVTFTDAIKSGNMYGTTGPLLTLSLSGVEMGGLAHLSQGRLSGTVRSAVWVGAQTISVQINGETIETRTLDDSGKFTFELTFSKDALLTVEVHGEAGADYQVVYPQFTPYAFTNPIYVDADGDGKWTAPGI